MILGLDISTSITGYTVLDDLGIVKECGHIDLKKCTSFYAKVLTVKNTLSSIFQKYSIDKVSIEESLSMFSAGKSSAAVLSLLTKFNGIISWLVFSEHKIMPEHIPATSARKQCGIKIVKGKKAKEQVMEYVQQYEKWYNIQYTKTGKPKPFCYDEVDSFVIAKARFLKKT